MAGTSASDGSGREATVRVRPLRWWDLEGVVAVERDLFGAGAWSVETFWSELAQPSRRYLALEDDAGGLAGYGGIGVNGSEADVFTLAVARDQQRRGLGGLLVRELVACAAEGGATSVTLEVRAGNRAAIDLYQRGGFERIAVRRGYYQPENEDAWIMRLRPLNRATGRNTYL